MNVAHQLHASSSRQHVLRSPHRQNAYRSLPPQLPQQSRRALAGCRKAVVVAAETVELLEDARKFIEGELPRAFRTGVLTRHWYAANLKFEDPIAKFTDYAGYVRNIQLLRTVFDIELILHDSAIQGVDTVVARWTMKLTPKLTPWKPNVVVTGKSFYSINVCSGKIISHVDVWDSVQDSSFPSLEAIQDITKQLADSTLLQTPNLETPQYTILLRNSEYEIRKYEPYMVAETVMPAGSGVASGSGFNTLASYIFGGNEEKVKMEMTTPVFTTATQGTSAANMQFVIESKFGSDTSSLPTPNSDTVSTKVAPARYVGAVVFSGLAPDWEVGDQERNLRRALEAAGYKCVPGYQLARYNEPLVLPPFRRNEVLIDLEEFKWT